MIDAKERLRQQLKDIKTRLRLSMNGAVSQSMREKGLVYKLNFGVELPRIKSIAADYEKDLIIYIHSFIITKAQNFNLLKM